MFSSALLFSSITITSTAGATCVTRRDDDQLDALRYYLNEPIEPRQIEHDNLTRCRFCGRKQPPLTIMCAGCGAPQ